MDQNTLILHKTKNKSHTTIYTSIMLQSTNIVLEAGPRVIRNIDKQNKNPFRQSSKSFGLWGGEEEGGRWSLTICDECSDV